MKDKSKHREEENKMNESAGNMENEAKKPNDDEKDSDDGEHSSKWVPTGISHGHAATRVPEVCRNVHPLKRLLTIPLLNTVAMGKGMSSDQYPPLAIIRKKTPSGINRD